MVLQLTCIICTLHHKQLSKGLTTSGERQRAGQGRAGQGRAGQGRAGQGRAGQGRAGQGRAGQGRAGQGRAGQGRAGQGRAGQGRAGQVLTCSFARVAYFSDSPITSSASCSGSLLNSRDSG